MVGTIIISLHEVRLLIFITIYPSRKVLLPFSSSTEKLGILDNVTQLGSGRARIQTQISLTPKPSSESLC